MVDVSDDDPFVFDEALILIPSVLFDNSLESRHERGDFRPKNAVENEFCGGDVWFKHDP